MREVQSITHDEVQEWVTALSGERSASVVLRAEGILKALLEAARRAKCIHDNPCDGLSLPRKTGRKHVYLTASELGRLADQCEWRRLIILTLGLCGLRWGELVALRVEDVDLQRDRLTVAKSITRVGSRMVETDPKTHEKRVVMFPAVLLPALKAQCAGRRPTDFLFTAPDMPFDKPMGNGWNPTRKDGWFASALRKAGIGGKMTLHDLRHTAASLMVQSGANVKTVQRQLGHKSAAMTLDTYADLFDADLDDLSARMGELLFAGGVGKMWARQVESTSADVADAGVSA
ncbi:tyrosine-type recombinase/integrase [Bifidobacterium moukalabense]|nr:site-specific integrase [Bifidobacterium moukalabense]ETY71329.1 integrase [Bifidobacterium moukalabense DSM 27321]